MATPIMITGVTTYEDVRLIDSVVDESEQGIFINAARLVDQVLRDARVFSTLTTRIGGLLGKPLDFEAAEPSDGRTTPRAEKATDILESDWQKMLPHDVLVELLTWGLMLNAGVAQVLEDFDPWKLEVWHPWALAWDEAERKYYLQTREDSRLYLEQDDGGGFRDKNGARWVLFTPWGYGNTRRNYLRCLHRLGNERQWTHRDRARFSEVFGLPTWLGIAPGKSSKEERAEYKKRLGPKGAEPVVVVAQGEAGNQWGLEIVQANAAGAEQFFNGTLAQLDREIATLFLGQSQTTDGQAGLGANELAGEPVRLDMMSADNEALGGALRTQFLMPYWQFAYGNAELTPWPCWRIVPPEDGAKKTLEFKQLMDGIAVALKAGIPVDVDELLEKFGVPALSADEQAALAAAQAKMAAEAAANAQAEPAAKGAPTETPAAMPPPLE